MAAVLCASAAQAADSPGVYALIIGPEYKKPDELKHTVPKAKAMRDLVQKTYPSAHVWSLIGADATLDNVRQHLRKKLPTIPEFSLVIIYFVGHGERTVYRERQRSALDLLLAGATTVDYYAQSISINEIYAAIKTMVRSNVFVLIDSCHSGGDRYGVDSPEDDFEKRGTRAFVLASCSTNEVSLNGIFTDVVMDVWQRGVPAGGCQRPAEFTREVQLGLKAKQPYMTVDSPIGGYIASCMSELGAPSMLVGLQPDRQPKYPIWIAFGNRTPEVFDPSEPIFIRSVPRQNVEVSITCQNRDLGKLTARVDKVKNDLVMLHLKMPDDLAESVTTSNNRLAESSLASAKAIEAFSGDAATAYLDAAREFIKLNPRYNTNALMQKVLSLAAQDSEESRVASILLEKKPLPVVRESLQLAQRLREVGGADIAAAFDTAWSTQAAQQTTTTVTVADTSGTFTAYTPGADYITFRTATNDTPVKYYYKPSGNAPTVVDADGKVIDLSFLRPDMPVRYTYVKEGDRLVVNKITLTKPKSYYEAMTTTTTTTERP